MNRVYACMQFRAGVEGLERAREGRVVWQGRFRAGVFFLSEFRAGVFFLS